MKTPKWVENKNYKEPETSSEALEILNESFKILGIEVFGRILKRLKKWMR